MIESYVRIMKLYVNTSWNILIKTVARCCKHGDEESEDFYNGGLGGGYRPTVSHVGQFVLGRNKTWKIQIVANPKKLLFNLICYNYVGGNTSSGARNIYISKEKFTNWLNERAKHSNIGDEKENSDDRLANLEEKTEKLQIAISNMDSKLEAILEKLISSSLPPSVAE